MNNDIFIIAVIVLFAVGLAIGIRKLIEKKKIQKEDLETIASLYGLAYGVIDELDLKNENRIKEISGIVEDSLNFCIQLSDAEEIKEKATLYAYKMIEDLGIELNDNRKRIVEVLIQFGIRQ